MGRSQTTPDPDHVELADTMDASRVTPSLTPTDPTDPMAKPPVLEEYADREDAMLGRMLNGRYRVEKRIGEGGMGTVYAAEHVHLRKKFAVKVLSERVVENREAIERLKQEAQAASRIDHDNIVDVVDFDATEHHEVFIVMELLKGSNLASELEHGRLVLERAVDLGLQICDALQAAHDHGIVHRDLKPENLFLVSKGKRQLVKVLDFGISKVKTAESEQVRVTRTGQLIGTPLYMSPEQARGEYDVDHRADVYAVGVILYEMITGTVPFEGANYFQLLWKHGNEPPQPPSVRVPGLLIPSGVEQAILRALEKRPADRYESMGELAEALRVAMEGRLPTAPLSSGELDLRSLDGGRSSDPLPRTPATTPRAPAMTIGTAETLDRAPPAVLPDDPPVVPQRKNYRRAAVILGILFLNAVALGVLISWQEQSSHGDATVETDVAPPHGAPTKIAPPATLPDPDLPATPRQPELAPPSVPAPAEAARVAITFDSQPSGAAFVAGDVRGVTPTTLQIERGDEPLLVRFTKQGYFEASQQVVPNADGTVRGNLRPVHGSGRRDPAEVQVKGW